MTSTDVPLARVTRGEVAESTHYGRAAICGPDGRLLASLGDPESVQYWRSSSKPIQALGVVTSGAADRFELTEKELAICCASHHGSAEHVRTVRGILEKLGLDESALDCGTHMPGDAEERERLICAGEEPSPLHNNCSGKHAGMLAAARALGVPTEGYLAFDHPVQELIATHLSMLSGVPRHDFIVARDGCGAPTVAMPLSAMARAFARLACPDAAPADLGPAIRRLTAAMAAEPTMVAGRGSFNTALLEACGGDVVAKGGAESLMCLGSRAREVGIAFKIADGSSRAQPPVTIALMRKANVDVPETLAERFERPEVTNCRGEAVGHVEVADLSLTMMA